MAQFDFGELMRTEPAKPKNRHYGIIFLILVILALIFSFMNRIDFNFLENERSEFSGDDSAELLELKRNTNDLGQIAYNRDQYYNELRSIAFDTTFGYP